MAEYLTDIDQVRTLGHLPTDTDRLPDSAFREHLAAASRILKSEPWIGSSLYSTLLASISAKRAALEEGENLTEDGELSEQEAGCRTAEAYLCLMVMVPHMNTVYGGQGGGIFQSSSNDGGSKSVLSQSDVRGLQANYRRMAVQAAGDDIQQGPPAGAISRARDDAGEEIT